MVLKIKTEEEYQRLLAQLKDKGAVEPEAKATKPRARAGAKAGAKTKIPKKKDAEPADQAPGHAETKTEKAEKTEKAAPAKRKGVKETPILTSLRDCSIEVEASPTHMTIAFKGARLFTLNEIYAMLQYRSYIVFAYKKQWHSLVLNALRLAGKKKPTFHGPCKVTLFRQGSKKVDRDSLMVMFKYIIDALKHEPKTKHVGLFDDDNPDIVYEDDKVQTIGEPIVAIRIEQIAPHAIKPDLTLADLFDRVPASLTAPPPPPPTPPAKKKTPSRAKEAPVIAPEPPPPARTKKSKPPAALSDAVSKKRKPPEKGTPG